MKKSFWTGFIIGVVYVSIIGIIVEYGKSQGASFEGIGMLLEMIIQPAGFIIGGALEYVLNQISLGNVIKNIFVYWGLIAITQGVFLGLVFLGVDRLLFRNSTSQ